MTKEFDFVKWINRRFYWEDPDMPHICGTEDGGMMLQAFDPRVPEDTVTGKTLKEVAYNWDNCKRFHNHSKEWKNGEWYPKEEDD